MGVTNDFLVKLASAIVYKANQYSAFLDQGVDDCCFKTQIQVLTKYFGVISDYYNGQSCVNQNNILAIVKNCNLITGNNMGYPDLVVIPTTSIISSVTSIALPDVLPAGKATLLANQITTISFNKPLSTLNYIILGNAFAPNEDGLQPHTIIDGSLSRYSFQVYTMVDTVFSWEVRLIA